MRGAAADAAQQQPHAWLLALVQGPLTQGREVGDSLGHLVAVQAHHHAASHLAIDADVEEDLLGDLGLGQGAARGIAR